MELGWCQGWRRGNSLWGMLGWVCVSFYDMHTQQSLSFKDAYFLFRTSLVWVNQGYCSRQEPPSPGRTRGRWHPNLQPGVSSFLSVKGCAVDACGYQLSKWKVFACVSVYHVHVGYLRKPEGTVSPETGVTASCELGTKLGSSAIAASTLGHWADSLVPIQSYYGYYCCCYYFWDFIILAGLEFNM